MLGNGNEIHIFISISKPTQVTLSLKPGLSIAWKWKWNSYFHFHFLDRPVTIPFWTLSDSRDSLVFVGNGNENVIFISISMTGLSWYHLSTIRQGFLWCSIRRNNSCLFFIFSFPFPMSAIFISISEPTKVNYTENRELNQRSFVQNLRCSPHYPKQFLLHATTKIRHFFRLDSIKFAPNNIKFGQFCSRKRFESRYAFLYLWLVWVPKKPRHFDLACISYS